MVFNDEQQPGSVRMEVSILIN